MNPTIVNPVKILYYPKNPRVRAMPPKILKYYPPGEKQAPAFAEAQRETINFKGQKIEAEVYTLPDYYARALLAGQPDRYYLLEPRRLIITVTRPDGLSTENKAVSSILNDESLSRKAESITVPDFSANTEPVSEVEVPQEVDPATVDPTAESVIKSQAKVRKNITAASGIGDEKLKKTAEGNIDLTSGNEVPPTHAVEKGHTDAKPIAGPDLPPVGEE